MEQTWRQAKAAFAAYWRAADRLAALLLLDPAGGGLGLFVRRQRRPHHDRSYRHVRELSARALEPLYLDIFVKSAIVAALTTLLCLVVGFPVALAIAFAGAEDQSVAACC